jgi:hypothetical protein
MTKSATNAPGELPLWERLAARRPERLTAAEWSRVVVRTRRNMQNGNMAIAAGTLCRVTGKGGGLSLSTAPCGCCKVRIFIRKVEPTAVEIVGPAEELPLPDDEWLRAKYGWDR